MAAAKPSAAAPGASCYVLSNLQHDGTAYEPGDSVLLPEAVAADLRALGVVSNVPPVADAEPQAT